MVCSHQLELDIPDVTYSTLNVIARKDYLFITGSLKDTVDIFRVSEGLCLVQQLGTFTEHRGLCLASENVRLSA